MFEFHSDLFHRRLHWLTARMLLLCLNLRFAAVIAVAVADVAAAAAAAALLPAALLPAAELH